jgi:hypothetical protein
MEVLMKIASNLDLFEACGIAQIDHKKHNTVYHYTSPDGLLGILNEDGIRLWFSKYDCLNDASEGQEIVKYYQSACKSLYDNPGLILYTKRLFDSVLCCH